VRDAVCLAPLPLHRSGVRGHVRERQLQASTSHETSVPLHGPIHQGTVRRRNRVQVPSSSPPPPSPPPVTPGDTQPVRVAINLPTSVHAIRPQVSSRDRWVWSCGHSWRLVSRVHVGQCVSTRNDAFRAVTLTFICVSFPFSICVDTFSKCCLGMRKEKKIN
jgi:hypothetical protein